MSNGESPAGGDATELLKAIAPHSNKKIRNAVTALAFVQQGWGTAKRWYDKQQRESAFTVSVPGDDSIYADVHAWVLDKLPANRRRAMVVRTVRETAVSETGILAAAVGGTRRTVTRIRLYFDGAKAQDVEILGHIVSVYVDTPNTTGRDSSAGWTVNREKVIFTAKSEAGRDAVLEWLAEVTASLTVNQPRVRVAARWGSWQSRSLVQPRDLESVVLHPGQVERLRADMEMFLGQEALYGKIGIPWHRGYLFYGVPGTGKTSVATALASDLGLDVYCISLGTLDNDGALIEALDDVQPSSVLLLEDIDVAHAARERTDDGGGVTLAGLLGALDGLATPHGLITILTTNHKDRLDSALLRPGRIDLEEEMLACDAAQVERLCVALIGQKVKIKPLDKLVTPADVVGVFKDHLNNPVAAIKALREWLAEPANEPIISL